MVDRAGHYHVVGASGERVMIRALCDTSAQALVEQLGLSRRGQYRAFEEGRLTREATGESLVRGARVEAGKDVVLLLGAPDVTSHALGPVTSTVRAEERVSVLWHDRFVLAVDKPAGLLVHGDGTGKSTLTDFVQAEVGYLAEAQGWPFVPTAQALNRLDVDTTGIVLFSLTDEFQPAFDALIASHDPALIRKRYLAVVEGDVGPEPHLIDAPLARDRHDARRMRVGRTGKPARTLVTGLAHARGRSLVAVRLLSGRRHQIRVHLAHEGHPVVGDALYGRPGEGLMLHAFALEFTHPVTGEAVSIHTPWPARFAPAFPQRPLDWHQLFPPEARTVS